MILGQETSNEFFENAKGRYDMSKVVFSYLPKIQNRLKSKISTPNTILHRIQIWTQNQYHDLPKWLGQNPLFVCIFS